MGGVINFEDYAVAHLRERLGLAEEANQDLIAFARGHSGAANAIHAAALAAIEADGIDSLLDVVTKDWPLILKVDTVALALIVGGEGFRADHAGVHRIEARMLQAVIRGVDGVDMRSVERGHPLFGPECETIRAEALIRIAGGSPFPDGVLALGQRARLSLDSRHGSELLLFLGSTLGAMIRRCLVPSQAS